MKDYIDNISRGTVNIIIGSAASGKSRISTIICKEYLHKNNCVVINMPHIDDCENLIKISTLDTIEIIKAVKDIKKSIIFIDEVSLSNLTLKYFFNKIKMIGDKNESSFVIILQTYRAPYSEEIFGGRTPLYVSDSILSCHRNNGDITFKVIKSRYSAPVRFSMNDLDILNRKSRIANIYE